MHGVSKSVPVVTKTNSRNIWPRNSFGIFLEAEAYGYLARQKYSETEIRCEDGGPK